MLLQSTPSEPAVGLLIREAGHRIRNDLHLLAAWIAQVTRRGRCDESVLQETISRILVIASLHDQLSDDSGGPCHMAEKLNGLADGLSQVAGCEDRGIRLEVLCEPVWLPPDQARLVLILTHELAVNAVRHAFSEAGGRVILSLRRRGNTNILCVSDNGAGLASPLASGGGGEIVPALVGRLGGTIHRHGAQPSGLAVEITWAGEIASEFEANQNAYSPWGAIVQSFGVRPQMTT